MGDEDDLAEEVRRLGREVDALRRRVADLEDATGDAASEADDESGATDGDAGSTASVVAPTPIDDVSANADASPPGGNAPVNGAEPVRPSDETSSDATRDDGRDWERDVGIKWLGLVGGLALVVGVVFFVRLAIDAGLLGPLGRVTLGALGGAALFAAGRFAAERQGYVRWGRIAAGVGLAITYFSLYAAYGFETYRDAIGAPLWLVLLALTAVVAAAVAISVRDRAPVVVGEAFLFGYATAFVGLDSGSFLLTPSYGLLLAAGLVAIATVRPWSRLLASSVLPTYAVLGAWIVETDPGPALVIGVVLAAFGTYLAGGYVLRASYRSDRSHRILMAALAVLNAGIAAPVLEVNLREWFPSLPLEGVAFAGVGLALVGVYAVTARRSIPRADPAGALSVPLFGIAVLLAADTFAATVGLLALAGGAVAVAALARADAFRTGAHAVAGGAALKLLVVDAGQLPAFDLADPAAAATGRAVAFLLGIVLFYGLAWWFRTRDLRLAARGRSLPLAAPYAWTATALTVVVLWLELSGAGVSVAWALFGLVLVGAGLATDVRGLRFQGVAVLGVVTAKVFLYDTRGLDTLARTLSFLTLGAILLAAAYGYARWQGEDPLDRLTGE